MRSSTAKRLAALLVIVILGVLLVWVLGKNDGSSNKEISSGVVQNYDHQKAIDSITSTGLYDKDKLAKLTVGLNLDEVNEITGSEGELYSEIGNKKIYRYKADDGYKLEAHFEDDKLSGIALIKE